MAGVKRPSLLKRQKEQRRTAKAAEKRAARNMRQKTKAERRPGLGPPMIAAGQVDEFGAVMGSLDSPDAEDSPEGDESERK